MKKKLIFLFLFVIMTIGISLNVKSASSDFDFSSRSCLAGCDFSYDYCMSQAPDENSDKYLYHINRCFFIYTRCIGDCLVLAEQ